MKFSNYQTLDPDLEKIIRSENLTEEIKFLFSLIVDAFPDVPVVNKNELDYLKRLQKNRTATQEANIRLEDSENGIFSRLVPKELLTPQLYRKLKRWNDRISPLIILLKVYYDRIRPAFVDPEIRTAIPTPDHPSYPSGHALQSLILGFVAIRDCDSPEKEKYRSKILKNAESISKNREVAGLHFPSDTEFSKKIAPYIFRKLIGNDKEIAIV